MTLKGSAHKFGDNINTDLIISGKYKFKTMDIKELSKHLMEDLDPTFYERLKPGDFIVGGKNFGCGSSREQAPLVIKEAGVGAVLASSFARIFFRNSINIGLPPIECETEEIEEGDELIVDLVKARIVNLSKGKEIKTRTFPDFILEILKLGGLVNYIKRYKTFRIGSKQCQRL
jgi:3-isopropylmalate/(R)-2-methylmalate dehydratase small subunit